MSKFVFGKASQANLAHVHPTLVEVAIMAISLADVDFSVAEGCRSLADEKKHVANGTSKTLNSQHLIQPDGFGHAVDLVPYINGRLDWDWDHIYGIVRAMRKAADELQIAPKIRWGGCWDKRLNQINCDSDSTVKEEVRLYSIVTPGLIFWTAHTSSIARESGTLRLGQAQAARLGGRVHGTAAQVHD